VSIVAAAGTAPAPLAFAGSALLFEAPLARGAGRLGRPAGARHREGRGDLAGEPLQRQLAVARLASRVLSHGRDRRPEALQQPRPLRFVQRLRRLDVEDRFDPRRGDVGVLAAGA
jgi:hypothetical protein